MNKKNDYENIILENNNDVEIEYNEDFTSEKIKSLNKFPTKLNNNQEFYVDNSRKNFSKSLNFNFRQCFAPISKKKKSNKDPAPLKFKKNENINKYNNHQQIIAEDALSEKESSINDESSISEDSEKNDNDEIKDIENNTNSKINTDNNNINNDYNNQKDEDINVNININEIKNEILMKKYEHKTISVFNSKNKNNIDNNKMKVLRNELSKIKLKCLKEYYKEVEYAIKNKDKNKYRLDLVKKKNENDKEYKIITINKIEEKKNQSEDDDENQDMSNFRTTISFMGSKMNKEKKNKKKENKGVTIFDVLIGKKVGNKK